MVVVGRRPADARESDEFAATVAAAGRGSAPDCRALYDAHAGRVLSRTMIMEHVWDESFHGLTNIVDVYVRHLRNKVDEPFPKKLIRTIRGAGYCLTDEPSA